MRVAILGAGAQEKYFRYDDDVEVWCLNHILFNWAPPSRMFNIHPFKLLEEYGYNVVDDSDWAMGNPDVPFYVADAWPKGWLPDQRIFPRETLAKLTSRGSYHCGSFDWMVAFAASGCAWPSDLGVLEEIELHGIGLCLEGGEPISARACLEYWSGYAEGQGIRVTAAKDCDIFHFYHLVKSNLVYGYEETPIYEDRTKEKKEGAPYDLSQARSAAIRVKA